MRNREKYENEIKECGYDIAVVNGKLVRCSGVDCKDCRFNYGLGSEENCNKTMFEWLYEEADENWIGEGLRELEVLMQGTTEQLEREYNPTKIFDTSDGKLQRFDLDLDFTIRDIAERINEIVDAVNKLKRGVE